MTKQPSPCLYCGEYGAESPGEECCGQRYPSGPPAKNIFPEIILVGGFDGKSLG